MESEAKVMTAAFALTGFSVALFSGLGAGNDGTVVLIRAVVCIVVCQMVGALAAHIAKQTINAHLERYRNSIPIPKLSTGSQPDESLSEENSRNSGLDR